MNSIEMEIRKVAKCKEKWCYYGKAPIELINKFEDKKQAMKFIKSYIEYSGKGSILNNRNLKNNFHEIEERATHIISAFFIGIKLFDYFEINVNDRDDYGMNLQYYWFLTCLYHDIGYAIEKTDSNKNLEQLEKIKKDGLDCVENIFDIKYFLEEEEYEIFKKYEINTYFKGRASDDNACIDHGIIGGLLLYDGLRKQFDYYIGRKNIAQSEEEFVIYDKKNKRDLKLSKKHYKAYAKAAEAIMAHNIYLPTMDRYLKREEKVKKSNGYIRISRENELIFILAIADTIEPLKKNLELSDIYIGPLKNEDGILGIQISFGDNDQFSEYAESIRQLEEWVGVDVTYENIQGITKLEIKVKKSN